MFERGVWSRDALTRGRGRGRGHRWRSTQGGSAVRALRSAELLIRACGHRAAETVAGGARTGRGSYTARAGPAGHARRRRRAHGPIDVRAARNAHGSAHEPRRPGYRIGLRVGIARVHPNLHALHALELRVEITGVVVPLAAREVELPRILVIAE